jgi:FkbM family methyltransferase
MNNYYSYSQYGEDSVLLNLFGEDYKGIIVDVGALDGFHLSNSFLLSQLGWKCLAIEAHPNFANICEKNRPESICIKKAVSNTKGFVEMELNHRGSHTTIVDEKTNKSVLIECDTLDNLIEENLGPDVDIDVISIDIDGSERFALQSFDLDRWKPKVIIVEITEVPEIIEDYLSKYGYHKSITIKNTNTFLVRDEHLLDKIKSIQEQSQSVENKLITKNFKSFRTSNIVDVREYEYYNMVQTHKDLIKEIKNGN